jgi:hypothetical protein
MLKYGLKATLVAAVVLASFLLIGAAPPPTCYGPECIEGGGCNFTTRLGTCISLCPCSWVMRPNKPGPCTVPAPRK